MRIIKEHHKGRNSKQYELCYNDHVALKAHFGDLAEDLASWMERNIKLVTIEEVYDFLSGDTGIYVELDGKDIRENGRTNIDAAKVKAIISEDANGGQNITKTTDKPETKPMEKGELKVKLDKRAYFLQELRFADKEEQKKPIEQLSYTPEEWETYTEAKNSFNKDKSHNDSVINEINQCLKEVTKEIIKLLPQSNTWFLIDEYAVGHQSHERVNYTQFKTGLVEELEGALLVKLDNHNDLEPISPIEEYIDNCMLCEKKHTTYKVHRAECVACIDEAERKAILKEIKEDTQTMEMKNITAKEARETMNNNSVTLDYCNKAILIAATYGNSSALITKHMGVEVRAALIVSGFTLHVDDLYISDTNTVIKWDE